MRCKHGRACVYRSSERGCRANLLLEGASREAPYFPGWMTRWSHGAWVVAMLCFLAILTVNPDEGVAQQTGQQQEQLPAVTVEPPARDRRAATERPGGAGEGFGADRSIPSGMPFSDYPLRSGEVVSATRGPAALSTVHSAVGIVENQGISAQGKSGLTDMLQGQTGLWTSGFAGNPFDSNIVMRGFSNESPNRVALLVDGRSLDIPRTEANTNFFFPEMIERVEVLRGDGNVQFGNKAIGGVVNVILKKPRQNPGVYFGVEGGSWHTDRQWAAINLVQGPIAAGIFLGRYFQEGFRIYEGNQFDPEPNTRPGPWTLHNMTASFNWKVTPSVTFDLMCTRSDARAPNPYITLYINQSAWERRDTRNIQGYFIAAPEERWDAVAIGRMLYDGGRYGSLEAVGNWRNYDRRADDAAYAGYYSRWTDFGLSFKYARTDQYAFLRNDLTLGSDLYDGRFRQRAPGYQTINGYRESIGYYVLNQIRLWDRLILGMGHRVETYDLKNLYAYNDFLPGIQLAQQNLTRLKSASQGSIGFVYDRELGSSVYYKHSRMYRFPNFDDMINQFYPYNPPIFLLLPEEGTLEEVGIRHWFNRNIFFSAIYYELDMDNEIVLGDYSATTYGKNINLENVSHHGLELEAMIRLTPGWTVKGNYTRQRVLVRAGSFDPLLTQYSNLDKWLWQNPADIGNLSIEYDNKEWGFSALVAYYYVGSRFRINDPYNLSEVLEPAKWGDVALSQTLFDGTATLYLGCKNFTDRQYALFGTKSVPPGNAVPLAWYPDAGRTFYGGIKTSLDFERMKLPTANDLLRMQRRLYGAASDSVSTLTGVGNWMRNMVRF